MKTHHTPGPWKIVNASEAARRDERGDKAIVAGNPVTIICEVICHRNQAGNPSGVYADTQPDAALIAAAPELLDALVDCLVYDCKGAADKARIKAQAAIAKAIQSP